MNKNDPTLFRTPFFPAYWRAAAADFKKPRVLVFAAMMIAACVALSYVPSIRINLADMYTAKVTWGFLARAVCGMVGGPVTALVFGAAEDTVSFLIHPTGPYFPGYALTTMLGTMIYALFLYRVRFTPFSLAVRVFFAKLFTNALNVTLGALWSTILSGTEKGYVYYATVSFWKNLIMLPVQAAALFFLIAALLPILSRIGLVPKSEFRLKKREGPTQEAEREDPWD